MVCQQLSRLTEMLGDACIEFDRLGTREALRRCYAAGDALTEHLKFHGCNWGTVRRS
jgi:hypothetical protein